MDKAHFFMGQIMFFVMLFVSTACNKLELGMSLDEHTPQREEVQASREMRIRELDARVRHLEAELRAVSAGNAAAPNIPGGMNWD